MVYTPRGSQLTAEQVQRVRTLMLQQVARYPSKSAYAHALGIKPPSLSALIHESKRSSDPSYHTALKVAELEGIGVAELLGIAAPPVREVVSETVDRYPNRAAVVHVWRYEKLQEEGEDPELVEEAVALVSSMALQSSDDPAPRQWQKFLNEGLSLARRRRREAVRAPMEPTSLAGGELARADAQDASTEERDTPWARMQAVVARKEAERQQAQREAQEAMALPPPSAKPRAARKRRS